MTLDHAGIAARVPHAGSMCLLDALLECSDTSITCTAVGHVDPAHPLRGPNGLHASASIEYAAQAMALHGTLNAPAGSAPKPGFIAAAREVRLLVRRLDDVAGAITVTTTRLAGDAKQALYRFVLEDGGGRLLAEGRATVVLDQPLAAL